VKAENFVNGLEYSTSITEGTYDLFASTFDEFDEEDAKKLTDEKNNVVIAENTPAEWDILLSPTP
jgi:hypothetical protein